MASLLNRTAESCILLLRGRPKLRFAILLYSLVAVPALLVLQFGSGYWFVPGVAIIAKGVAPPLFLLSLFSAAVSLIAYGPANPKKTQEQYELEEIRQRRREIQQRLSSDKHPDVLDTISLSLNQLTEYYTINKSQARNSFRFSVSAVIIGLVTLIAGIWLFYFRETPNIQLAAISSISGVLIQFIGAAYFYLYRKSIEQLNYFFGQLTRMQDTMLSIRLCEDISNPDKQIEIRQAIIVKLLDRGLETNSRASLGSTMTKDIDES